MRVPYPHKLPKALCCSFCDGGLLRAQQPSGTIRREPNFRCGGCNVRVVVTNQSYMPEDVRHYYWFLVLSKQLGLQQWAEADSVIST